MADWTNHLFDTLAKKTELGEKTLDACRRVLVPHLLSDGSTGVEKSAAVARDTGLFPAQISRSVATLRQRLVELGDVSNEQDFRVTRTLLKAELETSRDAAVSKARMLYGEDLQIKEAEKGGWYVGKPLVKTPGHVVQLVTTATGVEGILHDVSKLQQVPNMTIPILDIKYPAKGGLAEVREEFPGQTRGSRSR